MPGCQSSVQEPKGNSALFPGWHLLLLLLLEQQRLLLPLQHLLLLRLLEQQLLILLLLLLPSRAAALVLVVEANNNLQVQRLSPVVAVPQVLLFLQFQQVQPRARVDPL